MRGVDPAYMLTNYLNSHSSKQVVFDLATIKPTLLQGTKHGKLFAEVDNEGLISYHYDPTPNYIGNDRAVFQAVFEGKVYKIVVDIKVLVIVDETPGASECEPPKLIKVTKPSTGATRYGSGYSIALITYSQKPNPSFERDAAEARRPSTLRYAATESRSPGTLCQERKRHA